MVNYHDLLCPYQPSNSGAQPRVQNWAVQCPLSRIYVNKLYTLKWLKNACRATSNTVELLYGAECRTRTSNSLRCPGTHSGCACNCEHSAQILHSLVFNCSLFHNHSVHSPSLSWIRSDVHTETEDVTWRWIVTAKVVHVQPIEVGGYLPQLTI